MRLKRGWTTPDHAAGARGATGAAAIGTRVADRRGESGWAWRKGGGKGEAWGEVTRIATEFLHRAPEIGQAEARCRLCLPPASRPAAHRLGLTGYLWRYL
jgi:hypothetical protein